MDKITKEQRSLNMSAIRSKNTKPEILLRSALHKKGFRYRLHDKKLPGSPDIVLPKFKTVIFVHGCFWHLHPGCKDCKIPKSRIDYWQPKLSKNKERDLQHQKMLLNLGWNVVIVWECDIRKNTNSVIEGIEQILVYK